MPLMPPLATAYFFSTFTLADIIRHFPSLFRRHAAAFADARDAFARAAAPETRSDCYRAYFSCYAPLR